MVQLESKNIRKALNRLKNITGFVTTLCPEDDPRASVYNRYDHISRMLWINQYFCTAIGTNPEQSNEIILLHDLNRWPFAQNSEKGYFDQGSNIATYLPALVPDIPEEIVRDVTLLHQKCPSKMRTASRYAYVADLVAGMIEDPLFLIAGLNTNPEIVPERFAYLLGLDFSPTGIDMLRKLCETLNLQRDVKEFSKSFQKLFEKHCKNLIDRHLATSNTVEEAEAAIYQDALTVKEKFLRLIVFPINNEKVCHSSWIKRRIIEPLISSMGFDSASNYLLSVNEEELLQDMLKKGYIQHDELTRVYPDLDYTSTTKSEVKTLVKL